MPEGRGSQPAGGAAVFVPASSAQALGQSAITGQKSEDKQTREFEKEQTGIQLGLKEEVSASQLEQQEGLATMQMGVGEAMHGSALQAQRDAAAAASRANQEAIEAQMELENRSRQADAVINNGIKILSDPNVKDSEKQLVMNDMYTSLMDLDLPYELISPMMSEMDAYYSGMGWGNIRALPKPQVKEQIYKRYQEEMKHYRPQGRDLGGGTKRMY